MSLFRESHKEKFYLGIIIGTGSVNAILYSIRGKEKPKVIRTVIRPHSIMPEPDFGALEHYAKGELKEIKKILADVLKGIRIEAVNILLSSPWYFSQTRIVNLKREKPFIVEHLFLKENLQEEKERFIQNATKQFSFPVDHYAIIERAFMKILMNGYEVNNFLHKEATELTLDMYMSLSLKDFIDHMTHGIETHFSPHDIVFHTSPFILFKMAKQFWAHEENGQVFDIDAGVIVAEVGGEITDITVIRKGIIEETFSFGRGLHFIIRRLASAFNLVPKDAVSLFDSWNRGEIEKKQKAKIDSIVEGGLKEWRALLKKILLEASDKALLPTALILVGEGAAYPGFKDAFTDESFKEYILQNQPFEIKPFNPAFFRSAFDGPSTSFSGGVETALLYMLALPIEFNRID